MGSEMCIRDRSVVRSTERVVPRLGHAGKQCEEIAFGSTLPHNCCRSPVLVLTRSRKSSMLHEQHPPPNPRGQHQRGSLNRLSAASSRNFRGENNTALSRTLCRLVCASVSPFHNPTYRSCGCDSPPLASSYQVRSCCVVSPRQCQSSPCLLYTSPSPRDGLLSRMPSSA